MLFIVNPISGVHKKEHLKPLLEEYLDKGKYNYEIAYTEGPGHATKICKKAVKEGKAIIIAVGGDGSVNEIAKGLIHSSTALGIIPAGSGNGLAHHLGIPQNFKKAIDVINQGKAVKIDTGSINDQLFVSISGVGFDGYIARKFSKTSKRGFLTYARLVAEYFHNYKPKKYEIEINGKTIFRRALFLSFANSDRFGYFTSIAPNAKVDDGLLDVVIAEKPMIIEIPLLTSLMYWRKIDKSKYVEVLKTPELIVRCKKSRWVNVDGEAIKMPKELRVKIVPQSLKIIVP